MLKNSCEFGWLKESMNVPSLNFHNLHTKPAMHTRCFLGVGRFATRTCNAHTLPSVIRQREGATPTAGQFFCSLSIFGINMSFSMSNLCYIMFFFKKINIFRINWMNTYIWEVHIIRNVNEPSVPEIFEAWFDKNSLNKAR